MSDFSSPPPPAGPDAAPTRQNHTPRDVIIRPRNIHFDVHAELGTLWHGNSLFRTAYFNALSLQFPGGERLFIESVRAYRDQLKDPELIRNVRGFIGQEGIHGREHEDFNQALQQRGYDVAFMDARFKAHMEKVRRRHRAIRLAGTCAAEHFTAVLARNLLTHPEIMAAASSKVSDVWFWHAVEEIEHKSVAFDVYQSEVGSYRLRFILFFIVAFNFTKFTLLNLCTMLKAEGKLWSPKTWLHGLNFLWGKPGVIRKSLPELLSYLKPGFHPWQSDDRTLLRYWLRKLQQGGVVATAPPQDAPIAQSNRPRSAVIGTESMAG